MTQGASRVFRGRHDVADAFHKRIDAALKHNLDDLPRSGDAEF